MFDVHAANQTRGDYNINIIIHDYE